VGVCVCVVCECVCGVCACVCGVCACVFVYDPSYTEFLLPTSSSVLITFIRPKEKKLWCYQNRSEKGRHIRMLAKDRVLWRPLYCTS